MNLSKISQSELNLSVVADGIVTNAAIVSYHLFCPFCADFYLFEFTLKDHLKREHSSLIQKHFKNIYSGAEWHLNTSNCDETLRIRFLNEFNNVCDLCGAMFRSAGLIPKHIVNYHGTNCFAAWRQNNQKKSSKSKSASIEKICDTSRPRELYTKCSPSMDDMLDGMSTQENEDFSFDRTPIKSILKKSTSKSARIISSPSSSCIRRIKNSSSVKCSSSARRVLRFDIANTSPIDLKNIPFGSINGNERGTVRRAKSTVGKMVRRFLFGQCASQAPKKPSNCYMVKSTQMHFGDDAF